jgi:aldehyde dehydrogenase (NAD+)
MKKEATEIQYEDLVLLFQQQKKRSIIQRNETIKERKKRIRAFGQYILANRHKVGDAVYADLKRPRVEIDLSEVFPVLTEVRSVLKNLDDWSQPQVVDTPLTYLGTQSEIIFEPKGVCLILAPWNFPFNLCLGPLISCLAAGNTAILKPSEATPHTARLIREMVSEFFDKDLVAVVEGDVETPSNLLRLPFDHIFFTGSTSVGKIVMKAAAEHLTSVTLELGGKSPTFIDHTAHLDDAAKRIAFGKFLNNGQTCIAPDYILVDAKVKDLFIDKLRDQIRLLFGEGGAITEQSSHYARIINQKNFHRVDQLIQDAIQLGAKLELSGPSYPEKQFMHPIILSQVPPEARIMQEEIFGPVLPVNAYTSEEEAIEFVLSRPKPLAVYVFSNRKAFQNKILREVSAGSACINDCVLQFTHPNLPFGGVNASGIGKSHGKYGFLAFSNEKPVVRQRRGFAATYLLHPPYTKHVKRVVDIMLKWF